MTEENDGTILASLERFGLIGGIEHLRITPKGWEVATVAIVDEHNHHDHRFQVQVSWTQGKANYLRVTTQARRNGWGSVGPVAAVWPSRDGVRLEERAAVSLDPADMAAWSLGLALARDISEVGE